MGDGDADKLQKQAEALGVELPEDYLTPAVCNVWPEHWQAFEVFMLCQHQWRTLGSSVLGLDLAIVLQVANLYNVKDKLQVVEDVQVIAATAAKLINKQLAEN